MLRDRYFDRLGFSKEETESLSKPSKFNLDRIIEAHLANITFDNLSQHGLPFGASLDPDKTVKKILDEKRGGFCLELNALLGGLLLELGYSVKRVPAFVNTPEGFRPVSTHMLSIVGVPKDHTDELFLVDVGFGEPPIHSLKYELDSVQETPEGMISRLVRCQQDSEFAILEWKIEGQWQPRLKWIFAHPGQELAEFQDSLETVLGENSMFHQKLIVCKIDRTMKQTLAGSRLKITTPRFGAESKATSEELETLDAVKKVLEDRFNVPNTDGLELERSLAAKPEVWAQM